MIMTTGTSSLTPENVEVIRASVAYALTMLQAFESNPLMQYSGVAPGVKAIIAQLTAAQNVLPKPAEPEKPADPMLEQLRKMNDQIGELVKRQFVKP